jgi:hypothetical protein
MVTASLGVASMPGIALPSLKVDFKPLDLLANCKHQERKCAAFVSVSSISTPSFNNYIEICVGNPDC